MNTTQRVLLLKYHSDLATKNLYQILHKIILAVNYVHERCTHSRKAYKLRDY